LGAIMVSRSIAPRELREAWEVGRYGPSCVTASLSPAGHRRNTR
jgi:hypothetical protein